MPRKLKYILLAAEENNTNSLIIQYLSRKKDAEKIFAEAAAQNMTGLGYAWIVTEQVGGHRALCTRYCQQGK